MGHGDEGELGLPGYDEWKTRSPEDDYPWCPDEGYDEQGLEEPVSKYPARYVSGSKKAELNIEDMATPHLMNAWRKLGGTFQHAGGEHTDEVIHCIELELRSRGCTQDAETGRWVVPVPAGQPPQAA